MVQGVVKKRKSQSGSTKRNPAAGPKKGARTIAPKKSTLVKQRQTTKKHSAGLTARTERNLAEKVGHLELLLAGERKQSRTTSGSGKEGGGSNSKSMGMKK